MLLFVAVILGEAVASSSTSVPVGPPPALNRLIFLNAASTSMAAFSPEQSSPREPQFRLLSAERCPHMQDPDINEGSALVPDNCWALRDGSC